MNYVLNTKNGYIKNANGISLTDDIDKSFKHNTLKSATNARMKFRDLYEMVTEIVRTNIDSPKPKKSYSFS